MTSDGLLMRPTLRKLVEGLDLNPRPPTEAEAARLIGRARKAGKTSWSTLLRLTETAAAMKQEPVEEASPPLEHTSSAAASSTDPAPSRATTPVMIPRALRLVFGSNGRPLRQVAAPGAGGMPPASNVVVKRETPERRGPSAGTRSYIREHESKTDAPPGLH